MDMSQAGFRAYSRNSPEAAARIIALALISDGRMSKAEIAALDALQARDRLGLTESQWLAVISDLCADLLGPGLCGDEGCIPADLLDAMLDEVEFPELRRIVLRLCSAVVHADRRIDSGESFVLLAAIERWNLQPDDTALLAAMQYTAEPCVRASRVRPSLPTAFSRQGVRCENM